MANQNLVWESLERAVIRQRRKDREQALLDLVEVAVLYHEELQRDDPAHMGRLTQRRDTLGAVIDAAHEAIHPGPITDADLKYAHWMRRAEGREG